MSNLPDFLPRILDLQGTWETILSQLYNIFCKDFKASSVKHCGMRVLYDKRILPDSCGKEEGFWHVISKRDDKSSERLVDYRRAERLPWARPMMESTVRREIKVFDYDHGVKDTGVRRYIWLEDYNYVLVFQKKKKILFWVTAYYVTSDRNRMDLKRRYESRVQKTATALKAAPELLQPPLVDE